MMLNVGSGQRRFAAPWVNVDCVSRPPDQIPDVVCDGTRLPFPDAAADCVAYHHVIEHFGCGEADGLLREGWRVLGKGSLVVFVPDLRALAQRWLTRQVSDFIYCVNLYGAYQGLEGDRHRWGYSRESLAEKLAEVTGTRNVRPFDWRTIPGMDAARDWWILAMEAWK